MIIILAANGPVRDLVRRNRRRWLPDLLESKCPLLCLWNLTLPVAVTLTRFFKPLWVFNLGTCVPPMLHRDLAPRARFLGSSQGGVKRRFLTPAR